MTLGVAYTLSKSHGDGEARRTGRRQLPGSARTASSRAADSGSTSGTISSLTLSGSFPARICRGPLKYIIGGWQANGILSIRSGFPFTVTQGGDINTGGPTRPDRIADGKLDNPTRATVV